MARLLGEAYIAILPDTSGFGSQARAQIDKDLAALHPEANVGAQLNKTDITKIATQLAAITKANPVNVGVSLNQAAVAKMQAQLAALTKANPINVATSLNQADVLKMQAQLAALTKASPIDVDASLNQADVAKMVAQLAALTKVNPVDVDASLNQADVAKMVAQLTALTKISPIDVNVSLNQAAAAKMEAQLAADTQDRTVEVLSQLSAVDLAKMQTQLNAFLANKDLDVGVQLNAAQLARMQATFDAFVKEANDDSITPDYNILPALAKVAQLKAANASLQAFVQDQNADKIDFDIMPALTKIAELKTAEASLDDNKELTTFDTGEMTQAASLISRITQSLVGLTNNEKDNADAVSTTSRGYGVWGAAIGLLQNHIQLFGGALSALHFPDVLAQASGWHILAEAVIETLGVWVPATIAAVAFGAAAYKSAKQVYTQIMSMNTVMQATGAQFKGMTNQANSLSNAVKPEVYQLFGDYLLLAGHNSGILDTALKDVGDGLDIIGAKIVSLSGSGGAFAKFLQGGSKDLDMLIGAFGQLGRIIDVFLKSVPGYAEILLALGTGILTVTANVLNAVQPFIKWGLAIHGAIFYLGLASTAVLGFGRGMLSASASVVSTGEKMDGTGSKIENLGVAFGNTIGVVTNAAKSVYGYGTAIIDLSKSEGIGAASSVAFSDAMDAIPFGPVGLFVGILAASIGGLLYLSFRHTTDAAEAFNAAQQKLIDSSDIINIQQNIAAALAATSVQLQRNKVAQEQAGAQFQTLAKQMSPALINPVTGSFSALGQQVQNVAQQGKELSAGQKELLTEAQNTQTRMGALANTYGGLSAAQELVTLSGIKVTDVAKAGTAAWAQDMIRIQATAAAYGFMGQQAGMAGNQLDTLLLSQSSQIKSATALTGAESAFIQMLTGGTTALYSFEQGEKGGAKAALTADNAFAGQVNAGETLFGNLQNLSAASNNTKTSQIALAAAGKDIVAQLIPMAKGSAVATAQLYGLAQIAGYQGPDSLKAMTKWVGNTKDAEGNLSKQTTILTQSSANLAQDMKALASTMSGQVNQAIAQSIFYANGGQKAFNNLATAMKALNQQPTAQHFNQVEAALKPVAAQLIATVGPGVDAENMFIAMAAKMGITQNEAKLLWSAMSTGDTAQQNLASAAKNLGSTFNSLATGPLKLTQSAVNQLWANIKQQDLDMVSGKAANTKAAFIDFAQNGLHLTTTQAGNLWNELHQQGLDVLAGKASTTKAQFVNLAENGLHLTSTQASALWAELRMQYLDTLVQKGNAAENQFISLAKSGLGLTTSSATTLWNTLKQQYLDTLSQKAGETESAFEATAKQFGLTQTAASNLWGQLKNLSGGSPYDVAVDEVLSGSGSISAKISAAAIVLGGGGGVLTPKGASAANPAVKNAADIHAAGGAWISGNHSNTDTVPVMAKPGELIVPSQHSAAVANQLAAGGYKVPGADAGLLVPHFDAGGFVNSAAAAGSAAVAGMATIGTDIQTFTTDAMKQFVSDINGQVSADQSAAEGGAFSGTVSGSASANLLTIAKYLMGNGLNRAAAAGVAGTIDGESGGNPESRGSGGWGLIGWTGNVVGLPAGYSGPTGNLEYDMGEQLKGVIGYMNARGGAGPLNAAGNPVEAGDVWSRYEAPLVSLSDTRPGVANQIYAELGGASTAAQANQANVVAKAAQTHTAGGMISEPVLGFGVNSGMPYSFAENGPEMVTPGLNTNGNDNYMQPMTQSQGQSLIQLLQTMVQQGQQLPYALGKVQSQGLSAGMRTNRT